MHLPTPFAILLSCMLCVLTFPMNGITRTLDKEFVYFPEQIDYIQHAIKCPEGTIPWIPTGRCYREGEQGPCNFGRVLVFDQKYFKSFCKDEELV